ncbi:MAG: hypothetical protein M1817_006886 [Caeruleum heppii]|nr:MAG: hypothetical protein M1817_006886 [Caeruleum heppii]
MKRSLTVVEETVERPVNGTVELRAITSTKSVAKADQLPSPKRQRIDTKVDAKILPDNVETPVTPPDTPRQQRGFEDLPPEVRSMIYDQLFVKPYPVRPLCSDTRYFELPGTTRAPGLGSTVAFLRVNRAISREACETLYRRNDFVLYNLDFGDSALAFVKNIGKRNRQTIRSITFDWQHGFVKINQVSKASDLFAMVSDKTNPLRNDLAKMLHDVGRNAINKFCTTLDYLSGSPNLEHLTLVCPGTDNPGHPDNHCVEYHGCSGCHYEVPKVLRRFKGLKSLTLGDTDWHNELEALAVEMGAEEINVTQLDCIDLPEENAAQLEKSGWKMSIVWRDPEGDDFKRVSSKDLRSKIKGRGT